MKLFKPPSHEFPRKPAPGVRRGARAPRTMATRTGGDGIGSGIIIADPLKRARALGYAISDALDPVKAPGKVRTLADMTPEERAAIIAQYSRKP